MSENENALRNELKNLSTEQKRNLLTFLQLLVREQENEDNQLRLSVDPHVKH